MAVSLSIVSNKAILAIVFLGCALTVRADNENNNFTEQVKEAAKRGGEWIKEKHKAAGESVKSSLESGSAKWDAFTGEVKETWQKGKQKGAEFMEKTRQLSDERLGTKFAQKSNLGERGRVAGEQPKESDLIKLEVPWDADKTKLTGQEPILRGGPIVTTEEIGGEKVEVTSVDLKDDSSSFEWLSSSEAKLYGAGAIAIITVAGISYVLYKNRVPQRIYGYVAKNPVKSVITTACVLGIAAFVAHQQGVTIESVKNMFTVPSPAQ